MAKKVICACNKCCKSSFVDEHGHKVIGQKLSAKRKAIHVREQLAEQVQAEQQAEEMPEKSGQTSPKTTSRPVRPSLSQSTLRHRHKPPQSAKIIVPDLNNGE